MRCNACFSCIHMHFFVQVLVPKAFEECVILSSEDWLAIADLTLHDVFITVAKDL